MNFFTEDMSLDFRLDRKSNPPLKVAVKLFKVLLEGYDL